MPFFVSCGKKTSSDQEEIQYILQSANSSLSSGNFLQAITLLEEALQKFPEEKQIQIKLSHAYAGESGFEAIKLWVLFKRLEEVKEDVLLYQHDPLRVLAIFGEALNQIPDLSPYHHHRLQQALTLYHDMGLTPQTASREENIKWGALYLFRILVKIKETVNLGQGLQRGPLHESPQRQILLKKIEDLSGDLVRAYHLFKHSLKEVQEMAKKVEDLLKKIRDLFHKIEKKNE